MTKKLYPKAKRELERRLALHVLAGRSAEGGALALLVHAFTEYVERWLDWIEHGVDPFMGRRPVSLLLETPVHDAVTDDIIGVRQSFRIEQGRLKLYVSSEDDNYGLEPNEFEAKAYAAAIYNRTKTKPPRIVKILRITERATPERAKPWRPKRRR